MESPLRGDTEASATANEKHIVAAVMFQLKLARVTFLLGFHLKIGFGSDPILRHRSQVPGTLRDGITPQGDKEIHFCSQAV